MVVGGGLGDQGLSEHAMQKWGGPLGLCFALLTLCSSGQVGEFLFSYSQCLKSALCNLLLTYTLVVFHCLWNLRHAL